jgi:hypothetical protein
VTDLDPASRELLQAIAAMLEVRSKPQTAEQVPDYWQRMSDRAAIVRTACTVLLEHGDNQTDRARVLARELRLIAARPEPGQ